MDDFYDLLGVHRSASQDELKAAYRSKVREYHPDVNPDEDARDLFKLVNRAHDILSDPAERKDYDRLGHATYVRQRMDRYSLTEVDEILGEDGRGRSKADTGGSGTASVRGTGVGGTVGSGDASAGSASRRSGSSRSGGSAGTTNGRGSTGSASPAASSGGASAGTGESTRRGNGVGTASTSRTTTNGTGTDSRRTSSGSANQRSSTTSRTRSGSGRGQTSTTGVSDAVDPSTVTQGRRGRTQSARTFTLKRAWAAVAASLVVYVGGLAGYAAANGAALNALVAGLSTRPLQVLLSTSPLADPVAVAVTTVVAGELTMGHLLLPVGAIALGIVLTSTVLRYGSGTARLYVAAGVAPLLVLAIAQAGVSVLALDLLLLVILPVVGTVVFLIDVGRYLGARD